MNLLEHYVKEIHSVTIYTTEVVVDSVEFAESKSANSNYGGGYQGERPVPSAASGDGFMNIPNGIEEELPFQ